MKKNQWHMVPEHGLQVEETLAAGDVLGAQHLVRYWWAWAMAAQHGAQTIWDLGCGCGYGARILTEQFPGTVLAVDTDKVAVHSALKNYGHLPNLTVLQAYLDQPWTQPQMTTQRPDLVVAFEAFEQAYRHRDLFLEQLVARLMPGGVFLLSSPCAAQLACVADPPDAHFRYSRPILERLLRRYFRAVRFLADGLPSGTAEDVFGWAYLQSVRALPGAPALPLLGDDLIYCAGPLA